MQAEVVKKKEVKKHVPVYFPRMLHGVELEKIEKILPLISVFTFFCPV